jgi:hypothetical protein
MLLSPNASVVFFCGLNSSRWPSPEEGLRRSRSACISCDDIGLKPRAIPKFWPTSKPMFRICTSLTPESKPLRLSFTDDEWSGGSSRHYREQRDSTSPGAGS